jgi:hypothetical protein
MGTLHLLDVGPVRRLLNKQLKLVASNPAPARSTTAQAMADGIDALIAKHKAEVRPTVSPAYLPDRDMPRCAWYGQHYWIETPEICRDCGITRAAHRAKGSL